MGSSARLQGPKDLLRAGGRGSELQEITHGWTGRQTGGSETLGSCFPTSGAPAPTWTPMAPESSQPHKLATARQRGPDPGPRGREPLSDTLSFPGAQGKTSELPAALPGPEPPPDVGEPRGCQVRATPGKLLSGSLTHVLCTGQGEGQGPEGGQLPPANTHPTEGGEKSPGAASEEGPEWAGGFCSPRAGSGPVASRGWAGQGLPLPSLRQTVGTHSRLASSRSQAEMGVAARWGLVS